MGALQNFSPSLLGQCHTAVDAARRSGKKPGDQIEIRVGKVDDDQISQVISQLQNESLRAVQKGGGTLVIKL